MDNSRIEISRKHEVEVWEYEGKVWLSVESGDDRAAVSMTLEQASSVIRALTRAHISTQQVQRRNAEKAKQS